MNRNLRNGFLLIFCGFVVLSLFYFLHPKLNVGIIGVDNLSEEYLNVSFEGFNKHYSNYFVPIVLDEKVSSQNIRVNNQSYFLNNDFFLEAKKLNLFQKHNLDFLLIVTDYKIKDWDNGGFGVWGEANTKTNSALITIKYFNSSPEIIQNHANHEILHLLGFLHNPIDKRGIMQYTNNLNIDLVPYYSFQMPFRVSLIKLLQNKNFLFTVYMMNFLFSLVLFLFFFAINEFLYYYDNKKQGLKSRSLVVDFLGFSLFFIFAIFYNYSFLIFILPFLFLIGLHLIRKDLDKKFSKV